MFAGRVLRSVLVFGLILVGVVFTASACSCGSEGQAAGTCSAGGQQQGGTTGGSVDGIGGNAVPTGGAASSDCTLYVGMKLLGGLWIATAKATCKIPIATSSLTVSILNKPTGSSDVDWLSMSSNSSLSLPTNTTYAGATAVATANAECTSGDWQATAVLDVVDSNDNPGNQTGHSDLYIAFTTAKCAEN